MLALLHHRTSPSWLQEGLLDTLMGAPNMSDLFDVAPRPTKRHRGGSSLPVPELLGPMRLEAEEGRLVAKLAAPGVKADRMSVELVGNRVLQVRVSMDTKGKDRSGADSACASSSPKETNAGTQQPAARSTVVMERSVALPLLVDPTAITSTYADGLLRVDIPIQPPAMDDGPRARIAELEQEAKDADARIAELSKELTELKTKARDAHQAARREKAEAQRALQGSRHTLAITTGA
jgi:HSP20 family molecular chaperone IbpA